MKILALSFAEMTHLLFSIRRARRAFDDLADGAEALLAADVAMEGPTALPYGVALPEAMQTGLTATSHWRMPPRPGMASRPKDGRKLR